MIPVMITLSLCIIIVSLYLFRFRVSSLSYIPYMLLRYKHKSPAADLITDICNVVCFFWKKSRYIVFSGVVDVNYILKNYQYSYAKVLIVSLSCHTEPVEGIRKNEFESASTSLVWQSVFYLFFWCLPELVEGIRKRLV